MDKPSLSREAVNRIIAEKVMGYEERMFGGAGKVWFDGDRPIGMFRPSSDPDDFNRAFSIASDKGLNLHAIERWAEGYRWKVLEFNPQCAISAWQNAELETKARALAEALSTKGEEE